MSRPRFVLAACFALAAAATQSCSCGNKCSGVTCASPEACDPLDGVCKCGGQEGSPGGGANGVVCGPGETCSAELQACVGNLCAGVGCSNGTACDPADGTCKCGGLVCAPDELCDSNGHRCMGSSACAGVLCPAATSCDPSTGACLCGTDVCDAGQACIDGGCAADPCFGVRCPGAPGNGCWGGVCRCGGVDGPVCDTGQICVPASKTCAPAALCQGASCQGGAVCGPTDGLCHCGALDGPVCAGGAACVLFWLDGGQLPDAGPSFPDGGAAAIVGRCLGGDLCASVACSAGERCDEGTGICLCGGDGGAAGFACAATQFCGPLPGSSELGCLTPCDIYAQPPFETTAACPARSGGSPDASIPQACYYERAEDGTLCEPVGHGQDGDPCAVQSDCAAGFGCFGGSDAGGDECWAFCDTFSGVNGVHGCAVFGRTCVREAVLVLSDGGSLGVGACEPTGS